MEKNLENRAKLENGNVGTIQQLLLSASIKGSELSSLAYPVYSVSTAMSDYYKS